MRGFFVTVALCALSAVTLAAQDIYGERHERLDSVVVSASRAGKETPVTYTTVGKEELRASDPSFSLPMALRLQPSVVTWNEGGTGLGNSAMTIRGVKGSQINVTLNGVTLNDAESQEVFWVNIPALTSLISTVQLQRGLGTSASGAGAFGASVNMNTSFVTPDPFGTVSFGGGSYNTLMTTVTAGSSLRPNGLYATVAWSGGTTDGYIRNAFVRSQSAFVALGWIKGVRSIRLTWLMGRQRSGITWDGIDLDKYYVDRRYNGAGKYKDDEGNTRYYDNQTDNYAQHHLQLNYTRQLGARLTWTNTLNYTRGDGYDEYYKCDKDLAMYGFSLPVATPDGLSVETSDVIYRKKSDADFYVFNSALRYRGDKAELNGGVSLSRYDGDHFGELLWVRALGDGFDCSEMNAADSWYRSDSRKHDLSAFLRGEWHPVPVLTAYADMQYRRVNHRMAGLDDDRLPLDYDRGWDFFNPRAGLTWHWTAADRLYGSAALGHREPGRGDIKDNLKGGETPIRPEKMLDLEVGYQHDGESFTLSANLYMMEYWDILLETGRLNASGYAVKENMPRAWRRGVEFAASWRPLRRLRFDANATLSTNQIDNYVSFVKDGEGGTIAVPYGRTDMLMSPQLIGMARATVLPWKGGSLSLDAKYVGKQFIDNSMREELAIPAYCISDLELSQKFHPWGKTLELSAYVHNLFNRLYFASGWRWEAWDGEKVITGAGVYPQAPVNAMLKLTLFL